MALEKFKTFYICPKLGIQTSKLTIFIGLMPMAYLDNYIKVQNCQWATILLSLFISM